MTRLIYRLFAALCLLACVAWTGAARADASGVAFAATLSQTGQADATPTAAVGECRRTLVPQREPACRSARSDIGVVVATL